MLKVENSGGFFFAVAENLFIWSRNEGYLKEKHVFKKIYWTTLKRKIAVYELTGE